MEEYSDKSAWNLSQLWLQGINADLIRAHTYFSQGKPNLSFIFFKVAKMKLLPNLKKDEREVLAKMEVEISPKIKRWEIANAELSRGFHTPEDKIRLTAQLRDMALSSLEAYNEALLDFMEKYHLLLKKESDKTKIN